MKRVFVIFLFLVIAFLLSPSYLFARVGVGVGTGKIQVDEQLKPGVIYQLPSLTVLNTGDESSDYIVSIAYHQGLPQLRPAKEWFIFSPKEFHLDPGEVKNVDIKLNLPLKMEPGDYFAYLEAQPAKSSDTGNTSIGVAAAAKLYFTVVPASFLQGAYYKVISFLKVYAPWPQRISFGLGLILVLDMFKKYFNFQVDLKKSPDKTEPDKKDE
jgi:hypothetical protein